MYIYIGLDEIYNLTWLTYEIFIVFFCGRITENTFAIKALGDNLSNFNCSNLIENWFAHQVIRLKCDLPLEKLVVRLTS